MKTIEIHGKISVPEFLSHEDFIHEFAYFLAGKGCSFVGTTDETNKQVPIDLAYIEEQLTMLDR